jgi:hypothetical protein
MNMSAPGEAPAAKCAAEAEPVADAGMMPNDANAAAAALLGALTRTAGGAAGSAQPGA